MLAIKVNKKSMLSSLIL